MARLREMNFWNPQGPDVADSNRIPVSSRFFSAIIDYPRSGLLLLVLLTAVAIGGYYRPTWPKEVYLWLVKPNDLAEPTDEVPRRAERTSSRTASVQRASLGRADAFLVVESDQIFTREGAIALRELVEELEKLDTVASVSWLDQAPPLNIFGLPEPLLPRGQASEQRFAASKERALKHPLVVGQMLSDDARTVLISIGFDWLYVRQDSDCSDALIQVAKDVASKHPDVSMKFSVTGGVPLRLMMIQNQEANQLKFQVIGYGMILIMASILFRGISVVFVVAAAPALGVFWTLGFLRYFDLQFNPFSDVILPILLSLVGFTDGVHMMVHIRSGLIEGLPPREACKKTLGAVGLACFLTSLTTAIGMGSLVLAHHKVVIEFGWSCMLGVTATWISVMLVIPLICCTRWSNRLAKGADRGIVDSQLRRIGPAIAFVVRHARAVSYTGIASSIALFMVALTLQPDDRKSSSLPSGGPAQLALAHLDRSMGGLDVCRIQVKWTGDSSTNEQVLKVISEIDGHLDQEPLLGHPLSICKVLDALPGEGNALAKASMIELLPPPLKLALLDVENHSATVTFRVQDLGSKAYRKVFERVEKGLETIRVEESNFQFSLSGDAIARWKNLFQIVTDLTTSLGTASIIIFVVLGIAYRSLRLGLISIIPNMLPLAVAASWMAFTGQPLEVVSVCAFTVCIGIAVDDTIHFLSRYREEQLVYADRNEAIAQAFQGVGTGMIMTTVVLVAGFSSVLISETRDHRIFASLGIITLGTALLCDLLLLPALLSHFDRDRNDTSDKTIA